MIAQASKNKIFWMFFGEDRKGKILFESQAELARPLPHHREIRIAVLENLNSVKYIENASIKMMDENNDPIETWEFDGIEVKNANTHTIDGMDVVSFTLEYADAYFEMHIDPMEALRKIAKCNS